MLRRPTVLLLALLSFSANAETLRFHGYATNMENGKYLYTELHEQEVENGQVQTAAISYFDAAGKLVSRKTLDYRKNRTIPVFRAETPEQGYVEALRAVSAGKLDLLKVTREKGEQAKALDIPKGQVAADSGFNHLIQDNLPRILAGETVQFHLVVAGNLDVYHFRARKIGEERFEAAPAALLRVEPDSLLRFLVDPLDLLYDPSTRRLLEYRGVSNILDPATSKVYKKVRIRYSSTPPAEARSARSLNAAGLQASRRARTRPISEGLRVTANPHSSSTASLASAVSAPPLMSAPAWPMRRPGGAVAPAMKPTTGLCEVLAGTSVRIRPRPCRRSRRS
jgi:hypothetical protein